MDVEQIKRCIEIARDNAGVCQAEARRLRWNADEMDRKAADYAEEIANLHIQLKAAREREAPSALRLAPAVIVAVDERTWNDAEACVVCGAVGLYDGDTCPWCIERAAIEPQMPTGRYRADTEESG